MHHQRYTTSLLMSGLSFRQSYKTAHMLGFWVSSSKDSELNTCTNSSDVLLCEVASHGHNCRINLCLCLYLFTGSYLVADAIAYLSSLHCLNVVPPVSTHQCQVNTASSQIDVLVPGFQEPLTADLLLELISVQEINVLFDANV